MLEGVPGDHLLAVRLGDDGLPGWSPNSCAIRATQPPMPYFWTVRSMALAIISAVGASDGCNSEANSASHRASFEFSCVIASCGVRVGNSHHPVWLGRQQHPLDVGQNPAELFPGADAELGEHLAQVPLDRARANEQLGADLRVRMPVTSEPGDLRLLRGKLADHIDRALAHGPAGRQQLAAGTLGEPFGAHHG